MDSFIDTGWKAEKRPDLKELADVPLSSAVSPARGVGITSSPPVGDSRGDRFGSTPDHAALGDLINTEAGRNELAQRYGSYRRRDQKRLRSAIVEYLVGLAQNQEWAMLQEIGEAFQPLVVEGTRQQGFCCKLATTLAMRPGVPEEVIELIALPMIEALNLVLRVAAARTRDAAIEGMGALLKLDGKPLRRFPRYQAAGDTLGNPDVNRQYFQRLRRRRDMVLAVASSRARNIYLKNINEPLEGIIAGLRAREAHIRECEMPDEVKRKQLETIHADFETALHGRADRLRILPAVLRQNKEAAVPFVDLLRLATRRLQAEPRDPPAVQIAYARYQESVFRTLDVVLRRGSANWDQFDTEVAEVVKRIPRTLAGSPAVCNARIRATVAIVRTAATIVGKSERHSKTKEALLPFINKLTTLRPWLNLGIAEGCYRALPEFLDNPNHENLSKPILNALFKDLRAELVLHDFARAHRQLAALSCFRRLFISFADDAEEQQSKSGRQDERAREKLDRRLRSLLRTPDLETLQKVLRGEVPEMDLDDIAEPVIAGIAYECDLLRATRPAFQRWDSLSTVDKVLITRILALQMHAVSRDAIELARYPFLHSVFTGLTSVAMPEAEPLKVVWDILASLPAGAAEAAAPDIQRFVEYRGRRRRAVHDPGDHADDLPGYVLAMISPTVSEWIARGIAREIDLNLRHDRYHIGVSDVARPLYQVLLHGPHEAIFDHLLPRLDPPEDRRIAMLFRDHVAKVRSSELPLNCGRYDVRALVVHATSMAHALEKESSDTLVRLREALELFAGLASEEEGEVWSSIEAGNLVKFLERLDMLNAAAHGQGIPAVEGHRKPIEPLLRKSLIDLQTHVLHYMALPIDSFDERSDLLRKAGAVAEQIEKDLMSFPDLQPPEKAILVALAQHLRDVFERTERWFCAEARRLVESDRKDRFWLLAAYSTDRVNLLMRRLRSGVTERWLRAAYRERESDIAIEEMTRVGGMLPPRFHGQARDLEKYAVQWMSSDLDAAAVEDVLRDRWSDAYAVFFQTMTSLRKVGALILMPFLVAAGMHFLGWHWIEGLGFYLLAAAVVIAVIVSCTQFIDMLIRNRDSQDEGYWVQCTFPRLGRLIVVPMALMVEFDHSYQFPASASVWALSLLFMIAFLATQFAIARLVKRHRAPAAEKAKTQIRPQPGEDPQRDRADRVKTRRVVAVALSYSFAAAVLFSIIFADSHYYHVTEADGKKSGAQHSELTHAGDQPDFLGLPRRAFLDFAHLARVVGMKPRAFVEKHGQFTFYPTLLLSWTAYGLFFGLVLEGIFKGESPLGKSEENTAPMGVE